MKTEVMNKYRIEFKVDGAHVWLDASYRAAQAKVNLYDKNDCITWAGIMEILESNNRFKVWYRVV